MTIRMRFALIVGALISLELAIYGLRQLLAVAFEPVIRSLGA